LKAVKALLSVVLLGSVLPLSAQAPPQGQRQTSDNSDVERLRIQAEEKAREDIEQRDWETRIFPIRYVDLIQLMKALSMFRAKMQSSQELRVLSVRAPKEIMPAIDDAIKRLDVPQPRKEAELTIYVIIATDQADTSGSNLPPNLNPVLNQLKGVLAYKNYRLVDTLITRAIGHGNQSALTGELMLGETVKPAYRFFAVPQFDFPDGKTPVLHLGGMSFNLTGPAGLNGGLSGNVDVPQGQQVVVGKATLADKALILVMSAKFD
jgi:hypothetical protein